MKKITKKLAIFILTSFLINIFILGNTVLAEDTVYSKAQAAISALEKCEKKFVLGGKPAQVVIKFYEPMIEKNVADANTEIIDCYEHTLENDPSKKDTDGNPKVAKFTVSSLSSATCNDISEDGSIYTCKKIQVLLSNSGTAVMYTYISYIYKWASTIVGLIAVMVMIFSGIQIATSGGDTEVLSSAKSRIIKSLSGIAVLFLSGLILYTINPTFFTYT